MFDVRLRASLKAAVHFLANSQAGYPPPFMV